MTSDASTDGGQGGTVSWAGYRSVGARESVEANRAWWDRQAHDYHALHGQFLGDCRLIWGPEGLDEADARLLGPLAGRRVLEVGAGGASCSRWVAEQGAQAVATDLSGGMLAEARRFAGQEGRAVVLVQCDARRLPFADGSFDVAFTSYGAVPFVADPEQIMLEVRRVLRPGGRWVFSLTHPVRWAFPDDPGPEGLTAFRSYFDPTPYIEADSAGRTLYAEHHRTLGQRIRDVVDAGFVLDNLVEPRWPDGHERVWNGWSPLRGRLLPGTAIFVCHKPGA